MPRKELILHFILYAVIFSLGAKFLPLKVFLPFATIITVLHVSIVYRRKKSRYESLMSAISNIQSESMPKLARAGQGTDIDKMIFDSFKEVAAELEKKCYQLVEKNIQLLSMKELGLTIISSVDETRLVESVTGFLSKGLGFKEFFVSIFDPDSFVFNVHSYRDAFGKKESDRKSITLPEMAGLLHKTIVSRRPIFIKDPGMHPIGTIDGKSFFAESTMSSFVLVPLLKSTISQDCWEGEACVIRTEERNPDAEFELMDTKCPACGRFPVLGVIGVTDGFKAEGLSQVDLVSVETLALQVSTILENTQLYNELKKEEMFRENVINSMMNGLITADTNGRILLANQTAEKLCGYTKEELVGMKLDEMIANGGGDGPEDSAARILKLGKGSYQREMWLIQKGGTRIPIVLNSSFLVDEDRNVQGILAVFFDMTRIKMMEKKIIHLDKLAALGRFSSSIAHEIRNPLTGIATGIQYLKRAGNIPEDQKENVTFILNEVDRIDRLIGDLMNIVREGDLIYENTSPETIVKNSITSLQDIIRKKNIAVRTKYPDARRTIQIDADRITQVMINLIKNAVEASEDGSEIVVEISFPEDVSDVLFDGRGEYVIIKVLDHGVGLTPEEKDRVFEPFFSTKQSGTGLGLYVAHNFVERHGGSIFVESTKGAGSTFSLFLPTEKAEHGRSDKISHPLGG